MAGETTLPNFWVVVPAAGVGARMQADKPKQYLSLLGKTILEHTLERLLSLSGLQGIVVVLGQEDQFGRELALLTDARIVVADGGVERCDSVLNGLAVLAGQIADDDWVLVHDAARPCVAQSDVEKLLSELQEHPVGGILGTPVSDTIKRVAQQEIEQTLDRSILWQAQTPQMFRYGLLQQSLASALSQSITITDEASALESAGYHPAIVEGRRDNIKITRPEDLPVAELILKAAGGSPSEVGNERKTDSENRSRLRRSRLWRR
ncbi:MAG: 2-C-methyl-D-erythritol 4-phosphate cytidylyltransferase [Candidatus Pelagadaptatus aseana]